MGAAFQALVLSLGGTDLTDMDSVSLVGPGCLDSEDQAFIQIIAAHG